MARIKLAEYLKLSKKNLKKTIQHKRTSPMKTKAIKKTKKVMKVEVKKKSNGKIVKSRKIVKKETKVKKDDKEEQIDTSSKRAIHKLQSLINGPQIGKPRTSVIDQKRYSDQKKSDSKIPELNECCKFCNNRLFIHAVKTNNIALLKKLFNDSENITNPYQAYNHSDEDQNALLLACKSKNKEMIQLFVKDFIKNPDRKGLQAHMLTKHDGGDQGLYNFNVFIKEINQARGSKEGNDAFLEDNKQRNRNQYKYMRKGYLPLEFIKEFLASKGEKDKGSSNKFSRIQNSLLHYVRKGMVQEALHLAKIDFESGYTDLNRLYVAALQGELPDKIVKISINKQSRIHDGLSPLHCACINPNPHILKKLLTQLPMFSLPDKNRRNLIHYAAANQNSDVIKFLMANGCDPNELDNQRKTPLMIACELGRLENVIAIIDHFNLKKKQIEDKQKQKNKSKKPSKKAKNDDYGDEDAEDEDDESFSVNYLEFKDRSSWTALNYAAANGHTKIVDVLIQEEAEVNTKNSKTMTPLLNAIARGHFQTMKLLLDNDADIKGKLHKQKKNGLIQACANGHEDIVNYILDNQLIEVDSADTSGNTPLHYACGYGWPNIVRTLLKHGADPNKQNLWSTTPTSIAIQKNHYQILDIVLKNLQGQKVDDQFQDSQGRDLISQHLQEFTADTREQFATLVGLFKKIKIYPKQGDLYGYNAFHYLCAFTPASIAESIDFDKKKDDEDDEDNTPAKKGQDDSDEENDDEEESEKNESELDEDEEEDEDMEEDEEEDDQKEKLTTDEKKKKATYEKVCAQIIEIANLLEKWGYNYDDNQVSIDGHTPLTMAVNCQNIPMIEWLINKKVSIANTIHNKTNRNFLHFFLQFILDFEMKGVQETKRLMDLVYRTYGKDLKQMTQLVDVRGFTPLLLALNTSLCKAIKDEMPFKYVQRVIEVIHFMAKLDHKFNESVPFERSYDSKYLNSQEKETLNIEQEKRRHKSAYKKSKNNNKNIELQEQSNFGVIDLKKLKPKEQNLFICFNWIHFITQFILSANQSQKCSDLINLLRNFDKESKQVGLKQIQEQLMAQTMYFETPITMAMANNDLFEFFISQLNTNQLMAPIENLFRDGDVSYIHLVSLIRNQTSISQLMKNVTSEALLQQDSIGNTLLHYAAFHRNTELVGQILQKLPENKFEKLLKNNEGNTPLHLAVSQQKALLELPKLEEMLLKKFKSQLHAQNEDQDTPLMVALHQGDLNSTDPISLVKLFITIDEKVLDDRDQLDNTPLHIVSKKQQMPLTFSLIFQQTKKKNSKNVFGNTPLTEAIISNSINNALFILQFDSSNIQEYGYSYKSTIKKSLDKKEVLTEKHIKEQKRHFSIEDYIVEKINIHQLAMKNDFYGLYHLGDKQNAIQILIGILQNANFLLFKQLIENYTTNELKQKSPSDGRTLLHALAYSQSFSVDDVVLESKKEKDGDEEEEEEEEENNEDEDENKTEKTCDSSSEQAKYVEEIYEYLTQKLGLSPIDLDNEGFTPIHLSLKKQNIVFFELAMKQLDKQLNPQQRLQVLNSKAGKSQVTCAAFLLNNIDQEQEWQMKALQRIKKSLGNNFVKLSFEYVLTPEDIAEEKQNYYDLYDTTVKICMFSNLKNFKEIKFNALFDLIENSLSHVTSYLIEQGISFDVIEPQTQTQPIHWAAFCKDLPMIKILVEEAKIKLNQKQTKDLIYYLMEVQENFDKQATSYSFSILEYLTTKKILDKNVLDNTFKELNSKYVNNNNKKLLQKGQAQKFAQIDDKIEKDFNVALKQFENNKNINVDIPIIDNESEMENTHQLHVLNEGKYKTEMSVMMTKADLFNGGHQGQLRFYILQLLKAKVSGDFVLWTRWGRIGDEGQNQKTPFGQDGQAAAKEFKKILKSKSGHQWEDILDNLKNPEQLPKKYRILQIGSRNNDNKISTKFQNIQSIFNLQKISNILDSDIKKNKNENEKDKQGFIKDCIIRALYKFFSTDEYRSYKYRDDTRMMNMALTNDQISEAFSTLQEIQELIKQQEGGKKTLSSQQKVEKYTQIMNLNNKYYSLIPNKDFRFNFPQQLLEKYAVDEEFEQLKEIYDFSRAFKLSMSALNSNNPLNYVENVLPLKLKRLEEDLNNAQFRRIMVYVNQNYDRKGLDYQFQVSRVFQVNDDDLYTEEENQIYHNIHNHFMLWHGTKNQNLMGIMLKGLRIKPPGAAHCGSLFGNGIYFADLLKKSLDYTSFENSYGSDKSEVAYLLLCEVALGNIANYPYDWESDIYRPPTGCHSVRIMGKKGPHFNALVNVNNQIYPISVPVNYPKLKYEKGDKEFKDSKTFAEYLKNQKKKNKPKSKKSANKKKPKSKGKKKNESEDEEMESEEDEDEEMEEDEDDELKDIDQEENLNENQEKQLENSFLNIKERVYQVKPNVVNANYFKHRLNEVENMYSPYDEMSQYIIYSEKQVRIRYMIEIKKFK